ncbi:MAG: archaeosortase/exosortase family protein [Desulfurococcaceae archaeon]
MDYIIKQVLLNKPFLIILLILIIYFTIFYHVVVLWYSYATLELYSYLLITPLVLMLIYINIVNGIDYGYFHRKYFTYLILFLIGSFLIFYSPMSEEYADQMIILGFILLAHSIIILFSRFNDLRKLTIMIPSLLIAVPIPNLLTYHVSAILTRHLLNMVVPFSKLLRIPINVVESSGFIIVNVDHGNEIVQFNIAPVCSGIIGLFSVIAISPLIILVSFNGEKDYFRKILASLIGITLFLTLMFLSNVIRLTMVFYFTSLYGLEIGYKIFHYTPEIVMVLPIVYIVIKILDRIARNVKLLSRKKPDTNHRDYLNKSLIFLIPLLCLIPLAIPVSTVSYHRTNYIFIHTFNGPVLLFDTSSGLKELFVPRIYRGISLEYYGREREIEATLGSLHRIHVYRGVIETGKYIDIYVEFSAHPTIHIWELCLWWQNMTVYNKERFYIEDPSGLIIYSAEVLYYRGGYLNGVLSSWRNKYYTEKGLELARFTIMINSVYRNITSRDIEILRNLSEELILKSGEASIAKYSKIAGFDLSYYYSVVIPFTIVLTVIILIRRKLYDLLKILRKLLKPFVKQL